MSNPPTQLDSNEADLISRVCDGAHKAFEELVRPELLDRRVLNPGFV